MKKILLLFIALLFTGCAVGNKYNYQSSMITLPVKPSVKRTLILSVEDLRPDVLSGKVGPNFVGIQRGGFGNAFDVTTSSGKPMTEDMSDAVAQGLRNAGYHVKNVQGNHNNVYLVQLATNNGATRIVVLKVYEWKSDIYLGITLNCNLHLSVFDAKGELLAENTMRFMEEIGGGQIGVENNSRVMADEFAKRIGYLFNKQDVRSALQ